MWLEWLLNKDLDHHWFGCPGFDGLPEPLCQDAEFWVKAARGGFHFCHDFLRQAPLHGVRIPSDAFRISEEVRDREEEIELQEYLQRRKDNTAAHPYLAAAATVASSGSVYSAAAARNFDSSPPSAPSLRPVIGDIGILMKENTRNAISISLGSAMMGPVFPYMSRRNQPDYVVPIRQEVQSQIVKRRNACRNFAGHNCPN